MNGAGDSLRSTTARRRTSSGGGPMKRSPALCRPQSFSREPCVYSFKISQAQRHLGAANTEKTDKYHLIFVYAYRHVFHLDAKAFDSLRLLISLGAYRIKILPTGSYPRILDSGNNTYELIENDKVENYSITQSFNKQESWTKALDIPC
ncbi:hypothetical protein M8C21_006156 [Ambrosia artemisiifolia]|uniref:Uncharacterized protein n=1 Tax=Ambrosia artemisiifolia TaxID=4212 RepID=A0AAD5CWQ2_AMBAR|nr:hypothetical protein M8C21_006156 [Ambrosia artemisiifolia]